MKRESALVPLAWACAVVVVASLPYIAGLLGGGHDRIFVGFTYNIDDACVYSSWVRQTADGSFFIRNQFTTEPQTALQFNLFFFVLGLIARITHLSPAAVLHLARVVLGVALLMLVWKFSARFLKEPAERLLIVPVVGLASGLGWTLIRFGEHRAPASAIASLFGLTVPEIGGHQGPVDTWQPEAITFQCIYLNPLFLIGLILMIAALHFLLRMKETGSWRDATLGGLMLLLLGNIHTYDLLSVGVVWAAYLALKSVRVRRVPWRIVGLSVVAAAMALPSVAYQFYLFRHVEAFRERVESQALSPALWAYLMGYGLLLVLAVAGAWYALRQRRGAAVLVVWSIAGFALPYLPIAQQRKLVMGLHVPIAILAVIAIAALAKRIGPRFGGIAVAALVALLFLSNLYCLGRDIDFLSRGTTAPDYRAYLSVSEVRAMQWLREHTRPQDTVLAFPGFQLYATAQPQLWGGMAFPAPGSALFVPAVAGSRVYYGHWSETPGYSEKLSEWMAFVDGSPADEWRDRWLQSKIGSTLISVGAVTPEKWRRAFLRLTGARYIIYFARPSGIRLMLASEEIVPAADLRAEPGLRLVFESGRTAVYRVDP